MDAEKSLAVSPPSVLLVEDHPDVAAVARDYLEQLQCAVEHASSAESAMEMLSRRHFDLILSDIVMAGMSGLELARSIRRQHPDSRIILASGYSDKAAMAVSEGFALIRKPYSLETLVRAINQVLDGPQPFDRKAC